MALAQLVNSTLPPWYINSDGGTVSIADDGTINCKTINAVNINGENFSIGHIDEIRQLEMRVSVLENHIRAMQNLQESKYVLVLGE